MDSYIEKLFAESVKSVLDLGIMNEQKVLLLAAEESGLDFSTPGYYVVKKVSKIFV